VHLIARASSGSLQLDVEDDGLGFTPHSSGGVGLSNLRERMASLYGEKAKLVVQELARGTRVTITIPLSST